MFWDSYLHGRHWKFDLHMNFLQSAWGLGNLLEQLTELNEAVLNVFLLISELLMYDIWSCFFNCRLDSIKQPSVFSTLLVVTLPQHYAQALCIIRYIIWADSPPHHLPYSRYFCMTLANASKEWSSAKGDKFQKPVNPYFQYSYYSMINANVILLYSMLCKLLHQAGHLLVCFT